MKTPPKAAMAFRVGVAGHRPNRLPQDAARHLRLRAALGEVLDHVRNAVDAFRTASSQGQLYAPDAPVLRAVSPLAEGADRMFAEEALKRGYGLCCPMPFAQAEFENDFDGGSVAAFRALLDHARTQGLVRFELDGARNSPADPDAEARAYAAAGRVVVNQSDLLVVVWDGGQPAGNGGTVQALREALHYNVPVLWIDALDPARWQCLRTPEDLEALRGAGRYAPVDAEAVTPQAPQKSLADVVKAIVEGELTVPKPSGHEAHGRGRPNQPLVEVRRYLRTRRPVMRLAFAWRLFRDVVAGGRLPGPTAGRAGPVEAIEKDWPVTAGGGRGDVGTWINTRLRGHFAWADRLADHYADAYRSTSIIAYLVSAFAVFIALLPGAAAFKERGDLVCIVLEAVALGTALIMVGLALARHWHERWMDYRLLAELIRQLRLLVPMGGGRPFPHVPDHLALYGDPARSWMYWHMRAIARSTNLPDATVDHAYLLACLDHLSGVVGTSDGGQWGFHVRTGVRAHRLHHRLERAALVLFVLTFLGILVHLALAWPGLFPAAAREVADRWLVLLSALAPALGAALTGINNQGEFQRLGKRSAAMADGLARIAGDIGRLKAGTRPLRMAEVLALSDQVAELMIQEVTDWRIMFVDRPPSAA